MNDFATIDRLVTENIGLAVALADRQAAMGADFDEMYSVAMYGLQDAASRWDGRVPFGAFATNVIKCDLVQSRLKPLTKKRGSGMVFNRIDEAVEESFCTEDPHPSESFLRFIIGGFVSQLPADIRLLIELNFGLNGPRYGENKLKKMYRVNVHWKITKGLNMLRAMLLSFDPLLFDRSPVKFASV